MPPGAGPRPGAGRRGALPRRRRASPEARPARGARAPLRLLPARHPAAGARPRTAAAHRPLALACGGRAPRPPCGACWRAPPGGSTPDDVDGLPPAAAPLRRPRGGAHRAARPAPGPGRRGHRRALGARHLGRSTPPSASTTARLRRRHGAPEGLRDGASPGPASAPSPWASWGPASSTSRSDIDLIYVYGPTGRPPASAPLTHFAYYARLAELVTESLSKVTEDGIVFRVDLNLRPDGRSGPIVNSLRAAELYYQTFGRVLGAQRARKARAGAGDLAGGRGAARRSSSPSSGGARLDLGIVEEIQAMKARIDARAGAEGKDDLKLGQGGIREAEFFVSALQLLHGGKLRDPGAAGAGRAGARSTGCSSPASCRRRDRDAISDAYLFLRRAEHRVQMVDGRADPPAPPPEERLGAGPVHGLRRRREVRGRPLRPPRAGGGALRRAARDRRRRPPRSTPSWRCWPTSRSSRSAGARSPRAAASTTRTRPSPPSTPWPGAPPPSPAWATRPRRWRCSPRWWPRPTRTRPSRTSPSSPPPSSPPSPTSGCCATPRGSPASWSRSSAPPTSSPSASCATPSWSTSCSATTRWSWRRTWPTFREEIAVRLATVPPETHIDEATGAEAGRAAPLQERGGAAHRHARHRREHPALQRGRAALRPGRGPAGRGARAGRGGGAGQGADAAGAAHRDGAREAGRPRARLPLRPRPHLPLPGHRAGGSTPPGRRRPTSSTPAWPSASSPSCRCRCARGCSTRSTPGCAPAATRARW